MFGATTFAVFSLCLSGQAANGFTMPSTIPTATPTRQPASALNMFPAELSLPTSMPSLPSIVPEELSTTLMASTLVGEADFIEAEAMNGITHALLDFGTFWSQNAVLIRLLAVIGRLVVLMQSFAPGHEVLPDELAFQVGFLGLACHSLYQASIPKIQASQASSSVFMSSRDRQAYRSLFRTAGFSWQQYRELNLNSMEWVTMEPGQVILDEDKTKDAVYWLYQGNVQVQSEDRMVQSIQNKDGNSAGFLGENLLASLLDGGRRAPVENTASKSYITGDAGATLLRMDTTKLEHMMAHDDNLAAPFNRLVFNALQDKLDAILGRKTN